MKAKYILAIFCGMFLCEALSAQTEEFRFKLYMESLSSGKKDTLELGVGPNGIVGCDYDSTLCTVYTEPFFDTVEHIGAFIVPELDYDAAYSMCGIDWKPLGVRCSMYSKKRIGRNSIELPIVFPASAQPVKVCWECRQMKNPIVKMPLLVKLGPRLYGDFFGQLKPEMLHLDMREDSSCIIAYQEKTMNYIDSTLSFIYIEDSSETNHIYHFFSIVLGYQTASSETFNENIAISLFPNPAKERFVWKSEIPIKHWQIFSQNGGIVIEGNGNQQEIDCRNWASGVYVFRWESKNHETGFVKIVKE